MNKILGYILLDDNENAEGADLKIIRQKEDPIGEIGTRSKLPPISNWPIHE